MAADMVFQLHGMALRQLSLALDVHCQGLAQASRLARGRSLISNGLARRLLQLDAADNVCRHITAPYVTGFLAELPQVGGISVNGSVGDVDDGGVGSKAARFDISGKLLNLASGSSFAGDTNDFQKDMATASLAEVDSLEVNDDGSHGFDKEHNAGSTGEPCSSEVYDKHDDIKEQHSDTGNETVANSTVMHEVNNYDDIVDQFCLGLATGEKSAAVKLHQPENSKDFGRKSVDSYQYGGDENHSGYPARSRGGVEAGGDEHDPPCNDEDRIGFDLPVNNKELGSTVSAAVQLIENKLTRSDVEQQGFSTPVKQGGADSAADCPNQSCVGRPSCSSAENPRRRHSNASMSPRPPRAIQATKNSTRSTTTAVAGQGPV